MKKLESNEAKDVLKDFHTWDEEKFNKLVKAVEAVTIKVPVELDNIVGRSCSWNQKKPS